MAHCHPGPGHQGRSCRRKNYSQIPHRVATEAVEAVTQTQSMGNMALYAYVLPATDGHHGAARLFPDDQTPPAPWSLLFPEAMRMGMLTKRAGRREVGQRTSQGTDSGDDGDRTARKSAPAKAR